MAQKIPRYTSEGKLPSHPAAPTVNPAAMTPEADAVIQAGQGLAGLGGKMLSFATEQAREAKSAWDYATRVGAESEFDTFGGEYEAGLGKRDDLDNFVPDFDSRADAHISELSALQKDPNQQVILRARLAASKTQWLSRIQSEAARRKVAMEAGKFDTAFQNAVEDGRIEWALEQNEAARESGLISTAVYTANVNEASTEMVIRDNTVLQMEGPDIGLIDLAASIKQINASDAPRKYKQAAISSLRLSSAYEKEASNEMLNKQQQLDQDTLNDAFNSNTLTYEMIDGSRLSEEDQTRWSDRLHTMQERIAKGRPVVNDPVLQMDLEAAAVQVETDRAKMQPILDAANDAKAAGQLDDAAYASVREKLSTSYRASRKIADAHAVRYGIRQIIGVEVPPIDPEDPDARFNAIAQAIRLRGKATPSDKLRWQLFEQYMDDVRTWFETPENADRVKESYQVIKGKAALYKTMSEFPDASLSNFLGRSDKVGVSLGDVAERIKGKKPPSTEITVPTTQAEYDALPKGAKFKKPDGSIWMK